ncbi:MAG: hypothetical protein IIA67_04320 [Planctomycetes bacterium]|nr:hypothetical protein [Planctomycetota bacterium]
MCLRFEKRLSFAPLWRLLPCLAAAAAVQVRSSSSLTGVILSGGSLTLVQEGPLAAIAGDPVPADRRPCGPINTVGFP